MKKLAAGLAALVLLAGCAAQGGDALQQSAPQTTQQTSAQTTKAPDLTPATGTLPEIARCYLEDLLAGNDARLAACYTYDTAMEQAAADGSLRAALYDAFVRLGPVETYREAFLSDAPPYAVVAVPVRFENGSVNFNIVFDASERIAGVNIGMYTEEQAVRMPDGVIERDIEIPFPGGSLPGTLCMPATGEKLAVVVLVHGSGPSDRNETAGGSAPFRDIAWGLAQSGVATIRYDKRTLAAPQSLDTQSTVDDETVDDAVAAVQLAGQTERLDPARIYVLGHSLGGQLIPRIAARTP